GPAHVESIDLGHHPVENGQTRAAWIQQLGNGLLAVGHGDNVVAEPRKGRLEAPARDRLVICDQNSHVYSLASSARSRPSRSSSTSRSASAPGAPARSPDAPRSSSVFAIRLALSAANSP